MGGVGEGAFKEVVLRGAPCRDSNLAFAPGVYNGLEVAKKRFWTLGHGSL